MPSEKLTDPEVAAVIDALRETAEAIEAGRRPAPNLRFALSKIARLVTPSTNGLLIADTRLALFNDDELDLIASALSIDRDHMTDLVTDEERALSKRLSDEADAEVDRRPALLEKYGR